MMNKICLYTTLTLSLLTFVGCSEFDAFDDLSGSSRSSENLDPHEVASFKVVAIVSQSQIIPNFQNCLKLPRAKISAATRASQKEVSQTFSEEGEVEKISAPMLMAVTKVVAELCNDLIEHEKTSTRVYFPGFALTGSSAGTGNLDTTINKLASSCWGRESTEEERQAIKTNLQTNATLKNKTNRDTALFTCTALLSSSQAIKF